MKIAKQVFEYLENRPSLKQCLKASLINYSSLARKISTDLKLDPKKSFDAIMVACKRFSEKSKPTPELELKIIKYVKNGKFEMRTKVSVFILDDDNAVWDKILDLAKKIRSKSDNFHIIQGTKTMTVVLDDDFATEVEENFSGHIIRERKNLVQITHKTSEKIEEIPGFLNFLTSIFSENGINIYECASSWTDSIFLIEEKDAQKAFGVLNFKS